MLRAFAVFVHVLVATSAFVLPSHQQTSKPFNELPGALKASKMADKGTKDVFDQMLSGAIQQSTSGTWKSVTATFTVPAINALADGKGFGGGAAWVGMDVFSPGVAFISAGVNYIGLDSVKYKAFFLGLKLTANTYDIDIQPHDSITVALSASTPHNATVTIINHSNGQFVVENKALNAPLSLQDVEWMVSGWSFDETILPFPDFGTVTFSNASAESTSGISGPSKANIISNVERNNTILTEVKTSERGMQIKRDNLGVV